MKKAFFILLALAALLVTILIAMQQGRVGVQRSDEPLLIFCAAGIKEPVEQTAANYTQAHGVPIQFQFGGSATLLSQLQIAGQGDLFVAGDTGTMESARERGLVKEVFPLLRMIPVIAVAEGNPLGIHSLDDLLRTDVKVAICNPEAASIGKVAKTALAHRWEDFVSRVTVMKPTAPEITTDLSIGVVDAVITWEPLTQQFSGIESIRVPELERLADTAAIGVLTSAKNPAAALRFARYLTAPEKGGILIEATGFEPVPGDAWAVRPELILYSGGVNRPAVEELLRQFAQREGVEVTTVFNGCGILCATMQAMTDTEDPRFPDAYYACDLCFVPPVAEHFPMVTLLTETDIGIVVPIENPHQIKTLVDLTQPGLRVGICNAKQSTLGYMTDGILRDSGLHAALLRNVAVEVPTADFLINQMRGGALDAAIVYRVNAVLQQEHLTFLEIQHPGARAVQPFAIRGGSPRMQLAGRLLDWLLQNEASFTGVGFAWRADEPPIPSDQIEVPPWLLRSGAEPGLLD